MKDYFHAAPGRYLRGLAVAAALVAVFVARSEAQTFARDTPDPPPVVTRSEFETLKARVAELERRDGPTAASPVAVAPTLPPPRLVSRPVVVPAGHHAHRTVDGRTVIHSDANFGSAAAHAGIARPWPKSAVVGQVVTVAELCPAGVCPVGGQSPAWSISTADPTPVQAAASASSAVAPPPPVVVRSACPSCPAAVSAVPLYAPAYQGAGVVTVSGAYSYSGPAVTAAAPRGLFVRVREAWQNRPRLFGRVMSGGCP